MAASAQAQQTAVYVYGILPGDIELTAQMHGVGDPPGEVRVVRCGDLAALVSEVDVSRPLGSPGDLAAHEEILDASAADAPVLPMRFGAVVASEDAVAHDLLEDHRDEFTRALEELDGLAQYVVKGRYVEQAILKEILSENKHAARLRDEIAGAEPDATRDARIQLGEIVNNAITEKRVQDTRTLGKAMAE
ncbi:MAG TPA: GvpL/GvpF family gas vesicle protein, partial [Streptosporangiaceae bacterium]|nr:GvpL/GvpF family gas vesicle protein [Streptosporangiaceae bacterium]